MEAFIIIVCGVLSLAVLWFGQVFLQREQAFCDQKVQSYKTAQEQHAVKRQFFRIKIFVWLMEAVLVILIVILGMVVYQKINYQRNLEYHAELKQVSVIEAQQQKELERAQQEVNILMGDINWESGDVWWGAERAVFCRFAAEKTERLTALMLEKNKMKAEQQAFEAKWDGQDNWKDNMPLYQKYKQMFESELAQQNVKIEGELVQTQSEWATGKLIKHWGGLFVCFVLWAIGSCIWGSKTGKIKQALRIFYGGCAVTLIYIGWSLVYFGLWMLPLHILAGLLLFCGVSLVRSKSGNLEVEIGWQIPIGVIMILMACVFSMII